MPVFINPNDPSQPQKGVYIWKCRQNHQEIILYIGNAGKKETLLPKGTLFRGVSELQRGARLSSSPPYNKLDVDFIVGTCIYLVEQRGWICYWEHNNNDPAKEIEICRKYRPILQNPNTGRVLNELRGTLSTEAWDSTHENKEKATSFLENQLMNIMTHLIFETE